MKDLYGNVDLIVVVSVFKLINFVIEFLKELLLDYCVFYVGVVAARLESEFGVEFVRRVFVMVNDDMLKLCGMNLCVIKGIGVVGIVLFVFVCLFIICRVSRK